MLERNRVMLRKIPADTDDESEKRANPASLFSQAFQVPTHTMRTAARPEEPAEDETEDDQASDPDHEYHDAEETQSEFESEEEPELNELDEDEGSEDNEQESDRSPSTSPSPEPTTRTRAGRPTRPPNRYTPG
jgi:hypothetical protein